MAAETRKGVGEMNKGRWPLKICGEPITIEKMREAKKIMEEAAVEETQCPGCGLTFLIAHIYCMYGFIGCSDCLYKIMLKQKKSDR